MEISPQCWAITKYFSVCSLPDVNHWLAAVMKKLKEESVRYQLGVSGCQCEYNGITVFWGATESPCSRMLSTSLPTE